MPMFISVINRYKQIISYLFFGICTTIINIAVYYLCYFVVHIGNISSNMLAWIMAIVFAFITNKLFVFERSSLRFYVVIREFLYFSICRISTGIIDMLMMYLTIDVMRFDALVCKIWINIFIVVMNYMASRYFIFK